MADPNTLLDLPNGDLSGAMYQPLVAWQLWYRYSQPPRKEPWHWPYRHRYMGDRQAMKKVRDKCGIKVDPKTLARWKEAADCWYPPAGVTAWGYTRVSHDASAASGQSVEFQVDRLRKYHETRFAAERIKQGPILSDSDVSARFVSLRVRRGGRDLMHLVKPGDHIVFTMLDRGFRSTKDALILWEDHWKPRGITPHILQLAIDLSRPEGILTFQICCVLAEAESNWKQAFSLHRAQRAREQNRPRNQNAPLGYRIEVDRYGKRLRPDMAVRSVMALIERWRDEDGMLFDPIAQRLREEYASLRMPPPNRKYPSPLNGTWDRDKVSRFHRAWKEIQEEEGPEKARGG